MINIPRSQPSWIVCVVIKYFKPYNELASGFVNKQKKPEFGAAILFNKSCLVYSLLTHCKRHVDV